MSVDFERRTRKKKRWGRTIEYSSYERRFLFDKGYTEEFEKVKKSVGKFKSGVTPQELAQSNDIRVSVAKQMLNDLEKEGLVELIVKSTRVRFYIAK